MSAVRLLPLVLTGCAATGCGARAAAATAPRARDAMASIPGATYLMGTDARDIPRLLVRYHTTHEDLFVAETPRRSVAVEPFFLDRMEVTTADFARFLEQYPQWQRERLPASAHNGKYLDGWIGPQFPSGQASWPVTYVTWEAAAAYCAATGKRLPAEREWEWAARGGLEDPEFPWGDDPPDATRANWTGAGIGHPTRVGSFAPNGYGLFDMAGNVWEFTSDAWPVGTSELSRAAQAEGPGKRYAIRGGSYAGAPVNLRVRYRDSHPAGGAGPHVGFRCARGAR